MLFSLGLQVHNAVLLYFPTRHLLFKKEKLTQLNLSLSPAFLLLSGS